MVSSSSAMEIGPYEMVLSTCHARRFSPSAANSRPRLCSMALSMCFNQ